MSPGRLIAVAGAAALALAPAVPAASAAPKPTLTVLGDSVQASFFFVPQAQRYLERDFRVRADAEVCRRLTSPGCFGGSPESVLDVATALGPRLGDVVVVNSGYNDDISSYRPEKILRVLERNGVDAVVWVTLRRAQSRYLPINRRILRTVRDSPERHPRMTVRLADWNRLSTGRPWFAADKVHLNPTGAMALARLLRARAAVALQDAAGRG